VLVILALDIMKNTCNCPSCGKSLRRSFLHLKGVYSSGEKHWYNFVRFNKHCPFCDARLEERTQTDLAYAVFTLIFLMFNLGLIDFVMPASTDKLTKILVGLFIGLFLMSIGWLARAYFGFKEVKRA
jgi:hypothetical protein